MRSTVIAAAGVLALMKNILCRRCYRLFRYDEVGVLCRSERCARVPDERGEDRPRYLRPRDEGLWRRWRRRLALDAPCPYCRQLGHLAPACPHCRTELAPDVGDAEERIVAVIGASESGKSHFLATVLHQLLEGGAGGDAWRVSVAPRDLETLRRDFLRPLFQDQRELDKTPAEPGPEIPLTLEHRTSGERVTLVFRDLGGENFSDRERLRRLYFLRYAEGVVLMADPLAFAPPPGAAAPAWARNDQPTAVEVLANYRRVLELQERYAEDHELPLLPDQKYLAVAVTKADLVLPTDHGFWNHGSVGDHLDPGYWQRRVAQSDAVGEWVDEHFGPDLAAAASAFADVGWFFVSSYGYRHPPHTALTRPPRPLRVHEPIFALLDRLAGSARGAAADDAGL